MRLGRKECAGLRSFALLTMSLNCCCESVLQLSTLTNAAPRASKIDFDDGAFAAADNANAEADDAEANDNADDDEGTGSEGGDCEDMSGLRPCKNGQIRAGCSTISKSPIYD